MKTPQVIIIGAGAAGLMAAYELAKAGKTVTLLEARSRIGGRIHTINNSGFTAPAELGAEFVHGNLPVTLSLLKEAEIGTTGVTFEMWHCSNGQFEKSEEFIEGFDGFIKKLNELQQDMPLAEFLEKEFGGDEHTAMRSQIENYVAGYDTADVNDAGAFALRNEWNHEDEDAQHRVNGGYKTMIDFLANKFEEEGSRIITNAVVKEVAWRDGYVQVRTANGDVHTAEKVIVALPLGVLHADATEASLTFSPQIAEQKEALASIGFGAIIKILLEFDTVFWESKVFQEKTGANLSTMGFLFAEEQIPTFWTQSPVHSPLLTGWLGGPPAYDMKDAANEVVLEMTLKALSNIFTTTPELLREKLVAWQVANWTAEPFTQGSYAYDKVGSTKARAILQQPVQNTIYFAGEYLYDGPAMGTVEAALTSGKQAAAFLLKE